MYQKKKLLEVTFCKVCFNSLFFLSVIQRLNKILSTEMNVLRRSARKSRMERIKNEHIKEIMGVKEKPDMQTS